MRISFVLMQQRAEAVERHVSAIPRDAAKENYEDMVLSVSKQPSIGWPYTVR